MVRIKNSMIFMLMFALCFGIAGAVINVDVEVSPNSPKTGNDLECTYNVTTSDNETLEKVNLTWYNGSQVHTKPQISVENNTNQTNGTKTLPSNNTKKNETWKCEVYALGNASNESTAANQTVVNTEPSLSSISDKRVNVGKTLSFNVDASDPDADDGVDKLDYSLSNEPEGMEIDDENGRITWTPTNEQEGTYDMNVSVTDNAGVENITSFTVEVTQMMLAVDDLDVECSPESCRDRLDEEDGGSIERVRPGSTMEIEMALENLWDDDEDDPDIEDIEIIGILEEMGDEDEQEEEATKSKIRPGDDADFTLDFDIPEDADENTYYLDLEVYGEDEDDETEYEIDLPIDVEVEKESEKMVITRATLLPSSIACNRNTELDIMVKNIGRSDQERAQLVASNDELNINEHQFFDVDAGDYDEDDTEFRESYNLDLPDTVEEGTYEIEVRAYYEDGTKYERERVSLNVQECQTQEPSEPSNGSEDSDNGDDEVEVIREQIPPTQSGGQQTAQPVSDESFYDSTAFLVILSGTFVILLVAVILLTIIAFRK